MDKYVAWKDWRTYTIVGLAAAIGIILLLSKGPTAITDQYGSKAAYLDLGSGSKGVYLSVWVDLRDGNCDIVGAIVNPQDKSINSNFPLTVANGSQISPAAAASTKRKEFMVVWADDRNTNGSTWDVWAQRVDYNGNLIGNNFAISNDQYKGCRPVITYNSKTDEYLVIWDGYYGFWAYSKVYGKIVSSDGSKISAATTTYGTASMSGAKFNSSAAYISSINEYLIIWEEWRPYYPSFDNFSINGQRIDAAGNAKGSEFIITGPAIGGKKYKSNPQIAYNASKDISLIVWEDYRDMTYNKEDIYGILYQGGTVGGEIQIAVIQGTSQTLPAVSSSLLGFLVTYTDDQNQSKTKTDIYAQGVDFKGNLQQNSFPVSNDTSYQDCSSIAYATQDSSYLIVWTDRRYLNTAGTDIYGQHLTYKGASSQTAPSKNFAVSVNKVTGQLPKP